MMALNKILHVEDEPDIQEVAKLALESVGGFTVEACSSGQEALDKVADFAPDIILLDVMMPDMDGPATLQELRKIQELADTPIIFMTAKAQTHEIEKFKELGAIDVITKPFDPMTLADQIRDIWEKHHGR
ncbi:MAG: response regulator [Kiritimatiellia bacterium]|jgi:CheY-like chemotaxis protein|nr:response regulator [Kiritimatiellia bacterium]